MTFACLRNLCDRHTWKNEGNFTDGNRDFDSIFDSIFGKVAVNYGFVWLFYGIIGVKTKRKENEAMTGVYGVLYLRVAVGTIEVGNGVFRLIGDDGYGFTAYIEDDVCCYFWKGDEEQRVLLSMEKHSDNTYVAKSDGAVLRLLVWENGSYGVEFDGEGFFAVYWIKSEEPFGIVAKTVGDAGFVLGLAKRNNNIGRVV